MEQHREAPVQLQLDNIPSELKSLPQWVCWGGGGKLEKAPLCARTGRYADTTDPSTWGTFDAAVEAQEKCGYAGVGFVFTSDDPFVGVDLDKCRDENGTVESWAMDLVRDLDSYTEISPSGTGLHAFVLGKKEGKSSKKGHIEIYDQERYFTVTGSVFGGEIKPIREAQEQVDRIYALVNGASGDSKRAAGADERLPPESLGLPADLDVLDKLRTHGGYRFYQLFAGEQTDHNSASEADLALVAMIARHARGNREQIDRLFRASGRHRQKWCRDGYREATITKALGGYWVRYYLDRGEAGDADLYRSLGEDLFRFDVTANRWRSFQHGCWLFDEAGAAIDHISNRVTAEYESAVRLLEQERSRLVDNGAGEEVVGSVDHLRAICIKRKRDLGSNHRRKSVAEMVARHCPITSGALDAPPMMLNVRNGTLDLETARLHPHRSADLLSMQAEVEHDPDASCPEWEKQMEAVFPGDASLIEFFQTYCGTFLTGLVDDDKLGIAIGGGSNGKSLVFSVLMDVLGSYADKISTHVLVNQGFRNSSDEYHLAELRGKRLLLGSEIPTQGVMNEAMVKDLTGGDTLRGRRPRGTPFSFRPTHKLVLFGNDRPVIHGCDNGIWRRMLLIPFRATFSGARPNDRARRRAVFEAERSGILNWMLSGLKRYRAQGLRIPQSIQAEVANYRSDQDVVGAFFEEYTEKVLGNKEPLSSVYAVYSEVMDQQGERPLTLRGFSRTTRRRDLTVDKSGTGGKTVVVDIRLKLRPPPDPILV